MSAIIHSADAAGKAPMPASDALTFLLHRIGRRWGDLLAALDTTNFYIELLLDAAAFVLALYVASWLRKRVQRKVASSPLRFVDAGFVSSLLPMISPVMALLMLWITEVVVISLDIGGRFTDGMLQLAYAYFLSYCVLLIIKSRPVAYVIVFAIVSNAVLHALRITRSTSRLLDAFALDIGGYHLSALHLLHGLVIFIVVFWGAGMLSRTLENYLQRNTKLSYTSREMTVRFFRLFFYLTALVITLSAVGIDLTALAVFSGALGVGIGLGLQKLTANFVSGITMWMEKSIKIGDMIEVAGNIGVVRQLNIRYALVATFEGKEILIPNEELVSTRVINWTHSTTLARVDIHVDIDFESDPEKARELMLEAAMEHPICMQDPAPSCWLKEFTSHGVSFLLSFWIPDVTKGRSGPQSDVQFAILRKFRQAGIHLAKT